MKQTGDLKQEERGGNEEDEEKGRGIKKQKAAARESRYAQETGVMKGKVRWIRRRGAGKREGGMIVRPRSRACCA